jgi:6-phosphofructokinase 2
MASGNQTLYNAKGPVISAYELMQLIHKVEDFEQPEFVILSGSLPGGVNPEIDRKIIEISKSKGAKVILDTDGEALRIGLQECPTIIKPNIHELNRISNIQLDTIESIVLVAKEMRVCGLEIILVSMGAGGMIMICEEGQYLAKPPEVDVKNTIGAGDSAVAGFIYGLTTKGDIKEALKYSVASGTATILQTGTAVCKQEDFHALLNQITLEEI